MLVLRALIDPGFQTSFISQRAANKLGFEKSNTLASISGIGGVHATTVRKNVKVQISPNFSSNFELTVEVYVFGALRTFLPSEGLNELKPEWKRLQLSCPTQNIKSGIDLIQSAEPLEKIIESRIKWGKILPAVKRRLGWVLSGKVPIKAKENSTLVSNISTVEFQAALKRFSASEEVPDGLATANECKINY